MTILRAGPLAAVSVTALALLWSTAGAQSTDDKEKPLLYSYAASWVIPRAHWADMAKENAITDKILDRALASGSIVAYGDQESLVHTAEGSTHTGWWCAMSMAGLFNILDEFYKSGNSTNAVLAGAAKHWDGVYESRFYAWHPGSLKGGYVHGSVYKLKADAPADGVAVISRTFVVPLFEKLLTDGSVQAYQVAEQAIHTEDPSLFFIFYATAKAEGLDKVDAALRDALRANPLAAPAFGSMVDFSQHRDELSRGDSTFK
jgi:hypothetical protein